MDCLKCGNIVDDDSSFCSFCGSDVAIMTGQRFVRIGRDADNEVVENSPVVSGHHCRISYNGNCLLITDLGSTNGTFVNGMRLVPHRETLFNPVDRIMLGSYQLPSDVFQTLYVPASESKVSHHDGFVKDSERQISIGRGSHNDIVLDFSQISWEHAHLEKKGRQWVLVDKGSTNHTYVNDLSTPITRQVITEDDIIHFGSYKMSAKRLLGLKRDTVLGATDPHPIPIAAVETIFGRDPLSTVPLDYPQVSWHHAKLIRSGDTFILEDMGSTNGTYVNGKKVKKCSVTPQDTISLGSFVIKITNDFSIVKRDYRGDIRLDVDRICMDMQGKRILDDISLVVYPSEFVGLMGPSGAGKTTLFLALNGYSRPSAGTSKINGQSLYDNYDAFRGNIGYVPQEDIIHQELTVHEALYYTGKLRLPADTSDSEINSRVDNILAQLGLLDTSASGSLDVRNVIIGSPEKKGISGGQRKRVNLAMELLTDPSLLFLDEPTSGLSSEDTLSVMNILRKLADEGKTIILTLHQPSLEVYRKMDNLIVLDAGKLVYYGPTYPDSLTFFNPDKSPDEVLSSADNTLKGLKEGNQKSIGWQSIFKRSGYYKKYVSERSVNQGVPVETPVKTQKVSRSFGLSQWWSLTNRYFAIKRKDALNTAILLLQAPLIATLIAIVFSGEGYAKHDPPFTPLFLLIVSALWFGTSNAAREIVAENAIYRRERMVNLKIPSYVFSKYAVLCLLCLFQCIVMVGIMHPFLELKGSFLGILSVSVLASFAGLSIGLFVSAVSKTQQQALAIVPLILLPMVILGGALINVKDMNRQTHVLSYAVPSRWAYAEVVHVENRKWKGANADPLDGKDARLDLLGRLTARGCPSGDFVDCLYGAKKESEMVNLVVLCGFALAFILLTIGALKHKDLV